MTTPDAHYAQTLPRRPYVTTRALVVFALALRLAERLGHEDVTDIHIVLGMLQEGPGIERVLEGAVTESRIVGVEYHGVEHLLLSLLHDPAREPASRSHIRFQQPANARWS
jgi:hypothetical protein